MEKVDMRLAKEFESYISSGHDLFAITCKVCGKTWLCREDDYCFNTSGRYSIRMTAESYNCETVVNICNCNNVLNSHISFKHIKDIRNFGGEVEKMLFIHEIIEVLSRR